MLFQFVWTPFIGAQQKNIIMIEHGYNVFRNAEKRLKTRGEGRKKSMVLRLRIARPQQIASDRPIHPQSPWLVISGLIYYRETIQFKDNGTDIKIYRL